jgi:hypothetical protein
LRLGCDLDHSEKLIAVRYLFSVGLFLREYAESNHMSTSSLRKRFVECGVCGTPLISPELSEGRAADNIVRCPVCVQQSATTKEAINGLAAEDNRLEEFFSRFA